MNAADFSDPGYERLRDLMREVAVNEKNADLFSDFVKRRHILTEMFSSDLGTSIILPGMKQLPENRVDRIFHPVKKFHTRWFPYQGIRYVGRICRIR